MDVDLKTSRSWVTLERPNGLILNFGLIKLEFRQKVSFLTSDIVMIIYKWCKNDMILMKMSGIEGFSFRQMIDLHV